MADANIQGQIDRLVQRMQSASWSEFWHGLQITSLTFPEIGLNPKDPDSVVWHRCQERQVFLITNNRNDDRLDSLENTIRDFNTPQCLPVFTIGDADRILLEPSYRESVVDTLFEYLFDVDNIRGTGRLFLP